MFVTASYSRLFAVDVKTGQKIWKYEHRLPEGIMPCCDVVNRGAALYDDLVIFATLDAQLVALKQDTGDLVWKTKIDDYAAGYSATAAPIIAGGLLLTGVSGVTALTRLPIGKLRDDPEVFALFESTMRETEALGSARGVKGLEGWADKHAAWMKIAPPTINLDHPSVETAIDLVPWKPRQREINVALSNSFGFGGTNASLIVQRVAD